MIRAVVRGVGQKQYRYSSDLALLRFIGIRTRGLACITVSNSQFHPLGVVFLGLYQSSLLVLRLLSYQGSIYCGVSGGEASPQKCSGPPQKAIRQPSSVYD